MVWLPTVQSLPGHARKYVLFDDKCLTHRMRAWKSLLLPERSKELKNHSWSQRHLKRGQDSVKEILMLQSQEDLKDAKQFFLYLVNTEVLQQKESSLENLGPEISAEAGESFSSLLKI